jgi:hypothetical protein
MKYVSYRGTPYEKKVVIPEKKKFGSKPYTLSDVYPNYGGYRGHKTAKQFAEYLRGQGYSARVVAHSGFTAVYDGGSKKRSK